MTLQDSSHYSRIALDSEGSAVQQMVARGDKSLVLQVAGAASAYCVEDGMEPFGQTSHIISGHECSGHDCGRRADGPDHDSRALRPDNDSTAIPPSKAAAADTMQPTVSDTMQTTVSDTMQTSFGLVVGDRTDKTVLAEIMALRRLFT